MSQKTYLITNTTNTTFPHEFYMSRNPRYILFQNCRCVYRNSTGNDYVTSDIQVHADWIERDAYLNHFAGFANTILTKYKKWQVRIPRQSFNIWFTDMNGKKIPVLSDMELVNGTFGQLVEPDPPYISSFVLELLLIY
jgi:hypothetical protein